MVPEGLKYTVEIYIYFHLRNVGRTIGGVGPRSLRSYHRHSWKHPSVSLGHRILLYPAVLMRRHTRADNALQCVHIKISLSEAASADTSHVRADSAPFGSPSNLSSTAGFKFRLVPRLISCSVKHKVLGREFKGGKQTHTHTQKLM